MRSSGDLPSVLREVAQGRERRTEYLARAHSCRDMALRARDAHDAQFLGAMSIVWHVLAHRNRVVGGSGCLKE
jgi:hypothetical protein